MAALLDQVLLPPETQSTILERTAGNPLYAEEFVRLLRDGDLLDDRGRLRDGADVRVPEGIQALIAARLDGLDARDKAVLQAAAVVGKVFSAAEVAGVLDQDAAGLTEVLERLHRHEYVRAARYTSGDAVLEYSFWHVLVRDVAYAGLARRSRARMHAAFAEWLAVRSDRPEDVAEIAAHHAEEALALSESLGDTELTRRMSEAVRAQSFLAGDHLMSLDVAAAERYVARSYELTPPTHPDHVRATALRVRSLFGVNDAAAAAGMGRILWDAVQDDVLLLGSLDVLRGIVDSVNASFVVGADWDADVIGLFERYLEAADTDAPGRVAGRAYLASNRVLTLTDDDIDQGVRMARESLEESRRLRCWNGAADIIESVGRVFQGDPAAPADLRAALELSAATEPPSFVVLEHTWEILTALYVEGAGASFDLYAWIEDYEREHGLDLLGQVDVPVRQLTVLGRLDEALSLVASRGWDEEVPLLSSDDVLVLCSLVGREHPGAVREIRRMREVASREGGSGASDLLQHALNVPVILALSAQVVGDREAVAAEMSRVDARALARHRVFALEVPRAARLWLELGDVDAIAVLASHVSRRTRLEACNADTVDALLLEAQGQQEAAVRAFTEAGRGWAALDHLLEETYAVLGEGRCRAAVGDAAGVPTLLRAREMAAEMGAVAIVRECDAELARARRASS